MTMGEKIYQLRKSNNMTLTELGNAVGVAASTVRKWETGFIANLRRDKIKKLADALQTTPGYLMGWDDKVSSVQVGAVQNNNGVIGETHAPVTISNEHGPRALSKEEIELLRIYNQLSVRKRMELLSKALELEENDEE